MAHNNHPASDAGTSAQLAVGGLPFTGTRICCTHTYWLQLLGLTCCTESHTHWLQLLGLTCCTEDRLWRTTTTPPPMRAPLHSWLLAAYLSPGRVFVTHTHIGCSCLGSLAALRTGCGAQQSPRLGCGHLCTAGCWRPTFHQDAYLLHTHIGCGCLGSRAALRTGCGAQQPPRLGCGQNLHRCLLAAYLSPGRIFVAHTKFGWSCLGSLAAMQVGCGAQQLN